MNGKAMCFQWHGITAVLKENIIHAQNIRFMTENQQGEWKATEHVKSVTQKITL